MLSGIKQTPNTYTIGIDLGGTNTAVGLVDHNGSLIYKTSFPTSTPTIDTWIDKVFEEIGKLSIKNPDKPINGIGIGAPCANFLTQEIEGATDLPWESPIPVVKLLKQRMQVPVCMANDANCAAIGEMFFGKAKGFKNFIVLTLGTGVGAGIVVDGNLLNGKRGFAGELGHVGFHFALDRKCSCGRNGCLQTVASSKGIVSTALRYLQDSTESSLLRNLEPEMITARQIADAAEAGDSIAQKVFSFTGICLGEAAAHFAAFADPEAIILFGGVSKAGDLILTPMKESFKEHSLFLYKDSVELKISDMPDADAAVIGAASLPYVLNHETF